MLILGSNLEPQIFNFSGLTGYSSKVIDNTRKRRRCSDSIDFSEEELQTLNIQMEDYSNEPLLQENHFDNIESRFQGIFEELTRRRHNIQSLGQTTRVVHEELLQRTISFNDHTNIVPLIMFASLSLSDE